MPIPLLHTSMAGEQTVDERWEIGKVPIMEFSFNPDQIKSHLRI